MQYEFLLKHYTKITDLGEFKIEESDRKITKINFNKSEIIQASGWIEIEGHLRDEFTIINRLKHNNYFGSITNGELKLIVSISNVSKEINFNQGQKLNIIGNIIDCGIIITLLLDISVI